MDDDFLKMLNAELNKHKDLVNQSPLEDFDYLSPEDMHNIVYKPFQDDCPIQYKDQIDESTLDNIPFLNLLEYYLNLIITASEVKLTARGNLPTKLVKELYNQQFIKEYLIESGLYKLSKEEDSMTIQNVKIISDLAGFTKKRNNRISITKKGFKHIKDIYRQDLLKIIFETYGYKFNLGYHDGFEDQGEVQKALGYTMYLFLKYGNVEREISFYSKKILKAYPHILRVFADSYISPEELFENCFTTRIVERFLIWFDFIELREERLPGKRPVKVFVKNKLITDVFEIRNDKFKFRKEKFQA